MAKKGFAFLIKQTLVSFRKEWKLFVLLAFLFSFIPAIAIAGVQMFNAHEQGSPTYGWDDTEEIAGSLLIDSVGVFVSWTLSILLILALIEILRSKKKLNLGSSLQASSGRFWAGVWLTIITCVFLFGLFLLLIIPGIIFAVYWTFAYFALMDGLSPWNALKKSYHVVKGRWWRTFGYLLLFTLIVFLLMCFLIIPVGALSIMLWLISPLLGIVLLSVFGSAGNALVLIFMMIFLEKYYQLLKKTALPR